MNLQFSLTHQTIANALGELESLFKPHCKLTFLMRNPEVTDGDMIVTCDSLDAIAAAVEKLRQKEAADLHLPLPPDP